MSLKNYGEAEIQEDLNKLLLKVQKELKKKMFPRKHIKLLWRDVNIGLKKLDETILGTYETIKDKDNELKIHHKININNWVYDEYKNGLYGIGIEKRYCKRRLKNTIAHELIHAYVYEKYEWLGDEYGFHRDGSPVFLSILVFLNIPSGHAAMKAFKHTDIYKKVKEYVSFKSLEIYLIHLTCEYEKKFRDLETIILQDENKVYINNFTFSAGGTTGLKGEVTNTAIIKGCMSKANIFTVGANTDINKLNDLVLSKVNRNVFETKHVMMYCETIGDKKNKYRLQSMNI
ncbi:hypothetical protein BD780_003790 [Clostridium tetanomorphum]|uniref:SprT-like domain-containing protein n=1 Tax=Clostridium tetanomorphum TaxID=1553 RepID=A0A923E9J2_CLOTT|nr:hypothetical protein [Clostridium tetanomorphum]KAJ48912.1 hypothetical protein CTM_25883 [Clostridium tetanomorphum DSM 665]KAJ49735.1 hypothetical protein CTM_21548 [Clostridium tetanomorphum DSM 665]MBC2398970.1 hypothetical protein [Clostridium tetanomorphum]MBP1866389.1 hypothetical protein [Clostridium tetanomorphum]NRS86565.1 hypothetical protein [Clostridium tetanomorphum]